MSALRKRHKERTAESIRRVAVDMAFEHGLDNVTTEMISEKAGISPRTFFNYFAFKEAALLPPPLAFSADEIAGFVKAAGPLLDDIIALLRPKIEEVMLDKEVLLKAHEVALRHPKLLALRLSAFHEFDVTLAQVISARLGIPAKDQEVQHMAALISASIRCGFAAWAESDSGPDFEMVTARIAAIPTVFRSA